MKEKENGILIGKIDALAETMQRAGMNDYIEYLSNSKRIVWVNLIAGLARGLGIAVGFTLLGAVVIYILQSVAVHNIPVIGAFISEIVKIVQSQVK